MPIRRFNGTSDRLDVSIGAANLQSSALTIAYVGRMRNDGAYRAWFAQQSSGGVPQAFSERNEANHVTLGNGVGETEGAGFTFKEADGWCLIAITKASGSVKPKFYKVTLPGKVVSSSEGATALADPATAATSIRFGAWEAVDFLKADYAAAACWKKALSAAEVEALASAASLESWLTTSPAGLWLFNQSVVTEEVKDRTAGGANQTSRSGTEVIAEEPPIPYVSTTSHQLATLGVGA